MYKPGVIRVLVIDDSIVFQELITKGIQKESKIQVVGVAKDAFEARDKILELIPDVLTLDVELPGMDGIEFLRKLMPQFPIPTVVVSGQYQTIMQALEAGAIDFIKKPTESGGRLEESFFRELIVKIKIASIANVNTYRSGYAQGGQSPEKKIKKEKVIVIGASTGGTEAIYEIIKALPSNMPGIVITQHMPETFTNMYAQRLNAACALETKEAEDGDRVLPGRVLIAPGGLQTELYHKGGGYYVRCFQGRKVNGHMPSVDVLFYSAAKEAGADAMGVLLTGMGSDGAKGLLEMRENGAITIGQDETSSVVYGMPKVAYDIGGVSQQLPLGAIASKLYTLSNA